MRTTPISNREFTKPADGWYAIETPGEHPNRAADVIQVIDQTAVNSMVREFNGEAKEYTEKTGARWPGMVIDIEHFKHDSNKETRAYGWLMQLQNRSGTLYGQIKWTAIGDAAVDGGEYRFFSTEYDPKDLVVLNSDKPRRVRPMKLDGLTLTNQPNNPGVPITNRASPEGSTGKASPAVLNDVAAEQARHDRIKEPIAKWFQAVKQVKDSALTHLGYSEAGKISFQHAWELAKVHYPAEYAAAHGLVSETPADDDLSDVQIAGQQLTEVTNRISQIAGCDLRSAYDIAQREFPKLVNRLTPNSTRILNRESHPVKPEAVQKAAGKIINRMIEEAVAASGHPHSVCFSRVMGMEPILGQFAAGQISPGTILTEHPELWERLAKEA